MNPKLLLKTIFVIAILSLLVIMGMNNRQDVDLSMPPLLQKTQKDPAALMYFGFFAVASSAERRVGTACRSRWSPYH